MGINSGSFPDDIPVEKADDILDDSIYSI